MEAQERPPPPPPLCLGGKPAARSIAVKYVLADLEHERQVPLGVEPVQPAAQLHHPAEPLRVHGRSGVLVLDLLVADEREDDGDGGVGQRVPALHAPVDDAQRVGEAVEGLRGWLVAEEELVAGLHHGNTTRLRC